MAIATCAITPTHNAARNVAYDIRISPLCIRRIKLTKTDSIILSAARQQQQQRVHSHSAIMLYYRKHQWLRSTRTVASVFDWVAVSLPSILALHTHTTRIVPLRFQAGGRRKRIIIESGVISLINCISSIPRHFEVDLSRFLSTLGEVNFPPNRRLKSTWRHSQSKLSQIT